MQKQDGRKRLVGAALRFLAAAALCGGKIFGGWTPFVLGFVAAAGGGREGLAALLGCCAGAALLMDFSRALRAVAAAVLLYTANNAFCSTKYYQRRFFLPTVTASMYLAVEFVYLTEAEPSEIAFCAVSILLAVGAALCSAAILRRGEGEDCPPWAMLGLTVGFLMSVAAPQTGNGFSPGRIAAALAVMLLAYGRSAAAALTSALLIGLAMDLVAGETLFLHTAAYAICALAMGIERRGRRVGAAVLFACAAFALALPLGAGQGLIFLYETLCAVLIFLLLPGRILRGKRIAPPEEKPPAERERLSVRRRLSDMAGVFRELYESVTHTGEPPAENPAAIYDRAAERVCRACSMKNYCWHENYSKTYNALNDATPALLENGVGKGENFPPYFADRCIRFPSFLNAVNVELNAFLLRRSYREQLSQTRRQAAKQYAELSELLGAGAVGAGEAQPVFEPLRYRLATAVRPRGGEKVSGDSLACFETENGRLCLLLSDGMGGGEDARRESAMAVRLLGGFLKSGVDPRPALKTLNSALTLRGGETGSFTTVDLASVSLRTGAAELYKFGAAPSYCRSGGKVRRVNCTCLPAGLQTEDKPPEMTQLHLKDGAILVMITDGVADATDDEWLTELLTGWAEEDPKLLASAILTESEAHRGSGDDRGVIVLQLPKNSALPAREV